MYYGDIRLGDTVDVKFTTRSFTTGAPTQLAGTPAVAAYVGNGTTEITAGITLTVDFDTRTGLNNVRVVATSGNGYATATNVQLVITAGTVGGVSVVGEVIGSFSIEARSAVMPTVAARTLDVSAGGEAGIDWANVGSPTTAVNLSATNIDVDQVVASVSGAVGSVTGAVGSVTGAVGSVTGNVGGSVASVTTVNGLAAGVITAASIAADAITDAKVAADVTIASVTGAVGSVTGAVGSVTGNVGGNVTGSVGSVAAGVTVTTNNDKTGYALSAAGVDAVWDEATAGHVTAGTYGVAVSDILVDTAEIGAAGAGLTNINLPNQTMDIVGNITGNLSGSVGSVVGAVGSVTGSVGSVVGAVGSVAGNVGGSVASVTAGVTLAANAVSAAALAADAVAEIADGVWDEAIAGHLAAGSTGEKLNAAGSAGDPWTTALPGAYGAGSAGYIIGTNVNAPIATVDTVVDAIKAKTDSLAFTVAGKVDANIHYVNGVAVTGTGATGDEWGP